MPAPPPGDAWQVLFDTSGVVNEADAPRHAGGDVLRVARQSTMLLESIPSQE